MILGIDPGTEQSAFCVWDGKKIPDCGIYENQGILALIARYDVVAVEHIQHFGMAAGKSIFQTAYWIGEFRAMSRFSRGQFIPVFRSEIKMHFCHSVRAGDSNIRQALIDRFGAKGTKHNPGVTYRLKTHIWSAFAIAVFAHDTKQERNKHENKNRKLAIGDLVDPAPC